jgi:hypothetical protein
LPGPNGIFEQFHTQSGGEHFSNGRMLVQQPLGHEVIFSLLNFFLARLLNSIYIRIPGTQWQADCQFHHTEPWPAPWFPFSGTACSISGPRLLPEDHREILRVWRIAPRRRVAPNRTSPATTRPWLGNQAACAPGQSKKVIIAATAPWPSRNVTPARPFQHPCANFTQISNHVF